MKYKWHLFLGIFSFSVLVINNYLVDWESVLYKKVVDEIDELVNQQRRDLTDWQLGEMNEALFSKRFYCGEVLIKWSDNHTFPSLDSFANIQIIEDEHGIYLIQLFDEGQCYLSSAFTLKKKYTISNQYLSSTENRILHPAIYNLSINDGDYNYKDLFQFSLRIKPNRIANALAGAVLIVIIIHFYSLFLQRSVSLFLRTTVGIVFLRFISIFLDLTGSIIQYPIFSELNFRSSSLNPSLGDLLINVIIVFLIIIGFLYHSRRFKSNAFLLLLGITAVACLIQVHNLVITILDNSQVSMDIGASINFNILRVTSYLCVIIHGVGSLLLIDRLIHLMVKHHQRVYGFVGLGIGVLVFGLADHLALILLLGLLILVFFFVQFKYLFKEINQYNTIFLLFYCIIISAQISFTIYKSFEKEELEEKKKFANYLLLKRDILGESILNDVLLRITNDSATAYDERKILAAFSNPYFKKYTIRVEQHLNPTFDLIATDYEGILFIDENEYLGYLLQPPARDYSIVLQLKSSISRAVFPELLTDAKYDITTSNFDYAILNNGELTYQRNKWGRGDWPNITLLNRKELYQKGIEINQKHYFGIKTIEDERIILISSDLYQLQRVVSNFSFFLLIFFSVINFYYFIQQNVANHKEIGFSTKLQFYLSLSLIIPIIVTGIALLSSLSNSYRDEIDRNYTKRALMVSDMLQDTTLRSSDKQLSMIAGLVQADISVYNSSGIIENSSQPDIYQLGLQSNHINPIVFVELFDKENESVITSEAIGNLEFKVCYTSVRDSDENIAGFIAVPFFDSRNHLVRQKIEIFDNIINVFSFIFTLSILFGNLVIRKLLEPLKIVSDKISKVSLDQTNQPLEYNASDEIGVLINGYNKMLVKLEENKQALALSQKEMAWKGIAKQVAHEIKNPLTPMRLKIQQLLGKCEPQTKQFETLTILINQVETLDQIATSFSAFADMPAPNNQRFNFSELVRNTVAFNVTDEVRLKMNIQNDLYISADPEILRRILNNLILNAIQSVHDKEICLDIKLNSHGNKVVLTISDNGIGIPEELKDKIFVHYFSTKSSGSGIGLALAKKGIENAGGNIWFESEEGKGTTFYVSLPMPHTN